MLVRKKRPILTAIRYKPKHHLEDGFLERYQDKEDPNITWGIPGDGEAPIQIPYIENKFGKCFISIGDWILTREDGSRKVVPNKTFKKKYEIVKKGN